MNQNDTRRIPVGTTDAVSGSLIIDANGQIVGNQSKFVVDLQSLRSGSNQRDGYVQRNTLETSRFPTAVLVPTETQGIPSPVPTSGTVKFQLVGDLTVHGVTRTTIWEVTAEIGDESLTGTATTNVKFEDFGMTVPKAAAVLSVADNIGLEIDFHLIPQS